MPEVERILGNYPFVQRDDLIPILQEIQDSIGYLSEEAIVKVGKHLNIPASKVYGLATFYNQFRFEAKGKYHIQICNGTSCHVNTNTLIINELFKKLSIKNGEITKDGNFSLEETTCMGACGFGPVMAINGKYFTKLNLKKLNEVIEFYMNLEE
jgi:NADH-quinone oxidoreductase E subunit